MTRFFVLHLALVSFIDLYKWHVDSELAVLVRKITLRRRLTNCWLGLTLDCHKAHKEIKILNEIRKLKPWNVRTYCFPILFLSSLGIMK